MTEGARGDGNLKKAMPSVQQEKCVAKKAAKWLSNHRALRLLAQARAELAQLTEAMASYQKVKEALARTCVSSERHELIPGCLRARHELKWRN